MLVLTAAEINTWIAGLIWPLTRILGLITASPVFGTCRTIVAPALAPPPSGFRPAASASTAGTTAGTISSSRNATFPNVSVSPGTTK